MMAARLGALKIDGREYPLDDLTLDDLEELEEQMGVPMDQINWNSAKAMKHAAALIIRRSGREFTLEDAGRITIGSLLPDDGNGDGPSPLARAADEGQGGSVPATVGRRS
jgi:hypothetical protein